VFVGAMDLHSRTVWRVEIRLPKDRAYFETHSFWYNPTSEPTSLYHWMNAAAPRLWICSSSTRGQPQLTTAETFLTTRTGLRDGT